MCGQLLCGTKTLEEEAVPFYSPKKDFGFILGPEFAVKNVVACS